MLLLDDLLIAGDDTVRVELTVRDAPPFGNGRGGVPAYVGVEYMAQAACIFSGLELRRQGLPAKIGLLFGTRHYQCSVANFDAGQRLQVSARLLMREDSGLAAFRCGIYGADGAALAQADIKAFRPHEIREYLNHE